MQNEASVFAAALFEKLSLEGAKAAALDEITGERLLLP